MPVPTDLKSIFFDKYEDTDDLSRIMKRIGKLSGFLEETAVELSRKEVLDIAVLIEKATKEALVIITGKKKGRTK